MHFFFPRRDLARSRLLVCGTALGRQRGWLLLVPFFGTESETAEHGARVSLNFPATKS